MQQLELIKEDKSLIGYFFFILEFGIYTRYSKTFPVYKMPSIETQRVMIEIYRKDEEVNDLWEKYGLSGFKIEEDSRPLMNVLLDCREALFDLKREVGNID